jgi:hypothetical protein
MTCQHRHYEKNREQQECWPARHCAHEVHIFLWQVNRQFQPDALCISMPAADTAVSGHHDNFAT